MKAKSTGITDDVAVVKKHHMAKVQPGFNRLSRP
jgi:hypothetical protein